MRRRRVFVVIYLFVMAVIFASGASETGVFYYPRNVVNNSNVVIDLSDGSRSIGLGLDDFNVAFENFDSKHLALFRIEENLTNRLNDQTNSDGLEITIKSLDNWKFVHETNITSTRNFSIGVVRLKRARTDHWSQANWFDFLYTKNDPDYYELDSTEGKVLLGLSGTGASRTIALNYTDFEVPRSVRLYCINIYDYDFFVTLEEEAGYMESGFYSTRLEVTIPSHKTHKVSDNGTAIEVKENIQSETYYITLTGHVGDYETENTTYNFIVNSANDTYNMDLNKTVGETSSTPFQIARVQFVYSLSNKPSATANAESKFKVYISPTQNYRATYTSGTNPYYFIGRGTEYIERTDANTVYYSLCDSTGASFPVASEITGTDRWGNNTTSTISNTTYQLVPVYDNGYTTANKKYNESWTLDQYVYLKIAKDAVHDSGVYTTNIYFTLVVND